MRQAASRIDVGRFTGLTRLLVCTSVSVVATDEMLEVKAHPRGDEQAENERYRRQKYQRDNSNSFIIRFVIHDEPLAKDLFPKRRRPIHFRPATGRGRDRSGGAKASCST